LIVPPFGFIKHNAELTGGMSLLKTEGFCAGAVTTGRAFC